MGTIAGKPRPTTFESLLEQVRQFTCYQAWNLGIVYQPAADIVRRGIVSELQWFLSPRRHTILSYPSCRLVPDCELTFYVEYLDYRYLRGEIWVAHVSSGQDSITARFAPFLAQDFHMSYPFPFDDESGASLLTAETWQAGHALVW